MSAAERLAATAAAIASARAELTSLICEMRHDGATLAEIAAAAQMSRPGVLNVLRRENVEQGDSW